MPTHTFSRAALATALLLAPVSVFATPDHLATEQDFVVTAYYSPLPNQCCYVRGSLELDQELNGKGTHGADGTPVYPGMIAAPSIYPFGTRIVLPGLGTFTVHDRGGAITESQDGTHRLDVWAGSGEEGLARALAFGVKHIRGKVHPSCNPQPPEAVTFETLPAPVSQITPYAGDTLSVLALAPQAGDRNVAVQTMQQTLKELGYFTEPVTGFFGDVTKGSLATFLDDHNIPEAPLKLTKKAATLLVARLQRKSARTPLTDFVGPGSTGSAVLRAQRTLRFLGYYRGRTHGRYDDRLRDAIIRFQKDRGLIAGPDSPGAGRIGPLTKAAIEKRWAAKLAEMRAQKIYALERIESVLEEKGSLPRGYFGEGSRGTQVQILQSFLARRGFLEKDQVTGLFGSRTRDAVIAYQKHRGIIRDASDPGAGHVGPATSAAVKQAMTMELYTLVRAEGWNTLSVL